MHTFFKSWDKGAYNSVIAAAAPIVREQKERYEGAYLEGDGARIVEPSRDAKDTQAAGELWALTEKFVQNIGL